METEDANNSETAKTDFIILGSKPRKKKREVKRVLPYWLAHPNIISANLNSGPSLDELNFVLDSKLIEVLKGNGISKLFPVQASTIAWLLKCEKDKSLGLCPRDTCVSAPTGSGKTLAYVLPIVQHLQHRLVPKIRCLVVLPVQELAVQVYRVVLTYISHTCLKAGLLTGTTSFELEQSNIVKKTMSGDYISAVDIIVATPGRLIDHILKTPGFSLDHLQYLVIDEADRATEWLQYIPEPHSRAPPLTIKNMRTYSRNIQPAQKLLFSATLSQDPEKLNRLGLFQPILFTSVLVKNKDTDVNLDEETNNFVGRYTCPEELKEFAVECPQEYKPIALYQLLIRENVIPKTLVFTNSGETVHRLLILLRLLLSDRNVTIGELSARMSTKMRGEMLRKFATGELNVLISSDALARGIDIPDIQLVVSYDLPKHIKGYVHRAGRTGRAGKVGTAVSILTPNQVGIFKQMLTSAHKVVPNVEQLELDDLANTLDYQENVSKLREILEQEKTATLQRMKPTKCKFRRSTQENVNE